MRRSPFCVCFGWIPPFSSSTPHKIASLCTNASNNDDGDDIGDDDDDDDDDDGGGGGGGGVDDGDKTNICIHTCIYINTSKEFWIMWNIIVNFKNGKIFPNDDYMIPCHTN